MGGLEQSFPKSSVPTVHSWNLPQSSLRRRSGDPKTDFVNRIVDLFMAKLGEHPVVILEDNDPLLDDYHG